MKEQDNILKTIFLKPREYSDHDRYNTRDTRELTPIWDTIFTLYKTQRERQVKMSSITIPTKGNSKYHR